MDFFEHQQQARTNSKRLIALFALAVLGTVIAVNLVVAALVFGFQTNAQYFVGPARLPAGLFVASTLVVLAVIGGGTWWEMNRLATGGDAVAAMVGARLVDGSTRDLLERRLVNVVEEMALAAGTPVPRIYVMDNESGINAFAAGHNLNDAVVAVTRGTLTRLRRDELQGVIAHEFSHILNGDMALNLRLIGVLFGLMMIALLGRFLMEASRGGRSGRGGSALIVAGVGFWIIGYVGVFFGRLIKASVSRQREFLADASSVQFTRNPDGIGGALRKIGGLAQQGDGLGSTIDHSHAETLSHLFLGAARRSFARGLLATHPPLAERIKRVYGRTMEVLPAPEQPLAMALAAGGADAHDQVESTPGAMSAAASPLAALMAAGAAALGADRVSAAIGEVTPAAPTLTQRLQALGLDAAAADSTHAPLLVLALLVDKSSDVGAQQQRTIAETLGAPAAAQVDVLHRAAQRLEPGLRLPLLDRAMPALRKLAPQDAARLLMLAHTLILADGRVTLPEFLLYTVLKRRLGPQGHAPVKVAYRAVRELAADAARVLSLVAHVRMPDDPMHAYQAGVGLLDGVDALLVGADALALDRVSHSLERLNQLAPLAKPAFIKACTATAFVDGQTNWKAASCVRTICTALDAPLPPQMLQYQPG
jgi:Zn-dependent protease with chaperone function